MKKSILIDLLSGFSGKEIRDFDEFIHSPYFNKNQSIIKLFGFLKLKYPLFNKDEIIKRTVFTEVFPGVSYNDGFMRTLIFNLCSLAEEFIAISKFQNSYYKKNIFLLSELNDRQADRVIEKNLKVISKKIENESIRDIEYYYDRYNIENEKYIFHFRKKPDIYEKIMKKADLKKMIDDITCFYTGCTMSDYSRLLNLKNIYETSYDVIHFEPVLDLVKGSPYLSIPCVSSGYYELMLLLKNDYESYLTLKKNLPEYERTLEKDHIYNIYINLINFCSRQISEDTKGMEKEMFELYKRAIEKKIFPYKGIAHFRFFTTVAETAIKVKEKEWVLKFINEYKALLPVEIKENTYSYAMALYEYACSNYSRSLEILSKIKYNDVYHKLKCKALLAMLYYELGYSLQLLSHIDTFNHFLLNDKIINTGRKKTYSKFIRYLKKLENLRFNYSDFYILKLEDKLKDDTVVYNKFWLLEKLNQLIKKRND